MSSWKDIWEIVQAAQLSGCTVWHSLAEGKKRKCCSSHPLALPDLGNFHYIGVGGYAALSFFQLQLQSTLAMSILNHCFALKSPRVIFLSRNDFTGLWFESFAFPGERSNKLPIEEFSISAMVGLLCFVLGFCFLLFL